MVQSAPPHELYRNPVDRWVAEFMGEGEVVAGTIADGLADTPLGKFRVSPFLSGPADIMIRPEHVRLRADADGSAIVVDREFYGHDQLVTLHIEGGRRLQARTGPSPVFSPGDHVNYEITEVLVLPTQ